MIDQAEIIIAECEMLLGADKCRKKYEEHNCAAFLRAIPAELGMAGAIGWMTTAAQIMRDELTRTMEKAA